MAKEKKIAKKKQSYQLSHCLRPTLCETLLKSMLEENENRFTNVWNDTGEEGKRLYLDLKKIGSKECPLFVCYIFQLPQKHRCPV